MRTEDRMEMPVRVPPRHPLLCALTSCLGPRCWWGGAGPYFSVQARETNKTTYGNW